MENLELYYKVITWVEITSSQLISAVCLYIVLKHFVSRKRAVIAGITYFVCITILYYIPPVMPNLVASIISLMAVFLVLIAFDSTRIRLKAFLTITVLALRWLAYGSVSQIMMLMNQLSSKVEYYYTSILYLNIDFFVSNVLQITLCAAFLGFSVKMFINVYKDCQEELPVKEFIMLIMPMLAQIVGCQSVVNYYALYDKAMQAGAIDPVYEFNYTLLIFYVISYIAIIAFLTIYQELKKTKEDMTEQELLATQIANLKEHISAVEGVYSEIRGMRHDMANHLMILNELIQSGSHAEAQEYSQRMNDTIASLESDVHSGNPVTDVIIREYKDKFRLSGIDFKCDFHYPDSDRLDSFDMSIVLFNALQNAYEACEGVDNSYVEVQSFRKKNAFIIDISNTCVNRIEISKDTGLPKSDKGAVAGHGYGLRNIQRVAQEYYGDISISVEDGIFTLNIMMMLE